MTSANKGTLAPNWRCPFRHRSDDFGDVDETVPISKVRTSLFFNKLEKEVDLVGSGPLAAQVSGMLEFRFSQRKNYACG